MPDIFPVEDSDSPSTQREDDTRSTDERISGEEFSASFQPVEVPDFPPIAAYQAGQDNAVIKEIKEMTEELAEDMLRVMEWTRRLEARQEQMLAQVEELSRTTQDEKKQTVIEISQLRQELLGDKKAMVARQAFNAILPTLDSLRAMYRSMAELKEEDAARNQISAAVSSLTNVVQSLGFSDFQAEIGAGFDPFQMECLGYADGKTNTVIEIVRQGYKTGSSIIRPCGVIVGLSAQEAQPNNNGGSNE